jgi:HK97 family phage major capsid protein
MDSSQLRRDRFSIVTEMRTLADSTKPADASRWKELNEKQEQLRTQIENSERTSALETEMAQVRNNNRPPIHGSEVEERSDFRSTEAYGKKFRSYLSSGSSESRAALSVSADGVLIPTGFEKQLEVTLKAYSRMRKYCTVITSDSGNSLPWPIMDDTANSGSWLAEAAAMNQTSPTFSNVTLAANLLSSDLVLVSVQALQDFAFNAEAFLAEAFGVRLGRGTNKAYTVGDGSTIPVVGLLTALVAAGGRSVRLIGSNSNSGSAGDTNLNSIGSDDFDNLIAALDPAYRDGAMFQANQATWDTIRMMTRVTHTSQRLREAAIHRPVNGRHISRSHYSP